MTVDIFENRKL